MQQNTNISQMVSSWVGTQRELAAQLQITPASLSAMLGGKVGLPLNRFLQIVHILKPPKDEVDKVFAMYLADLGISPDDMVLIFRSYHENALPRSARETVHQLVDRLQPHQLDALEPILHMMTRDKA
jgi:hypothetical protein